LDKKKFETLVEAIGDLGWDIVIPVGELDEDIQGLVIGKPEFLESIVKGIEELDEAEKKDPLLEFEDEDDGKTFH